MATQEGTAVCFVTTVLTRNIMPIITAEWFTTCLMQVSFDMLEKSRSHRLFTSAKSVRTSLNGEVHWNNTLPSMADTVNLLAHTVTTALTLCVLLTCTFFVVTWQLVQMRKAFITHTPLDVVVSTKNKHTITSEYPNTSSSEIPSVRNCDSKNINSDEQKSDVLQDCSKHQIPNNDSSYFANNSSLKQQLKE